METSSKAVGGPPNRRSSSRETGDVGSDEDTIGSLANSQGKVPEDEVQHSAEDLDSARPERSAEMEMSECFIGSSKKRLRVYVYELPRKFNFGLFERRPTNGSDSDLGDAVDEKPWGQLQGEENALPPKWPWSGAAHPTAKQHSMEYFIVADLILPPTVCAAAGSSPHSILALNAPAACTGRIK